MAKVMTLDGLQSSRISGKYRRCTPVRAWSKVLNEEIMVCKEDIERIESKPGGPEILMPPGSKTRQRRGRPKGTTVRHGAKRPRVSSCTNTKVVTTKTGRKICKCATPGNSQILPHNRCNLKKGRG